MRPLEATITDQSRLKAANIRLQYAEQTNMRLQREVNANALPALEEITKLRKALAATEADLAAAKEKLAKRCRKAPPVDATNALASLCAIHLLEMAERLQEAGLDPLPGPQVLGLGDLSAPLVEANLKFISIRTPESAPVAPDQPKPTKRRTRKAPTPD